MSVNAPGFIAGGNISPARVVKQDSSANFHVLQATGSGDKPIGICQDGTHMAPGVSGDDGYAAISGLPITVYGEGEQCLAKVGSGGITAGDYLKSDASGQVVTVANTQPASYTQNTGIWIVGIALETASAGEFARVLVKIQRDAGESA